MSAQRLEGAVPVAGEGGGGKPHHVVLAHDDVIERTATAAEISTGWPYLLSNLKSYVETGGPCLDKTPLIPARAAAKLGLQLSARDLRHARVSSLLSSGADLPVIKRHSATSGQAPAGGSAVAQRWLLDHVVREHPAVQ